MRALYRIVILVIVLLLAACQTATPMPEAIPTLAPTLAPPTEIPTATPLPGPTATPRIRPDSIADDPADQVYFRLIHAAPDIPAVDIYVEVLPVAGNFTFGGWTEPIGIAAGQYSVQVVSLGAPIDEAPLLRTTMTFTGGQSLIVVLSGTSGNLSLTAYPEFTDALNRNESRFSAINAVAGLSVAVRQGNSNITPNLATGQQSSALVLASGMTDMIFVSGDNVLLTHPLDLRERFTHTLVLIGNAADLNSLAVIDLQTSVPGRSSIRVINGSASIGSIDVYLGSTVLAQNLDYPRASNRQFVPTSLFEVQIFPSGADIQTAAPLIRSQLNTNPDDAITLIVVGPPENAWLITQYQDMSKTPSTQSRIAFVNGMEGNNHVRVDTQVGPLENVPILSFGQISPEILTDSGQRSLYWTDMTNNIPGDLLETAENIQLDPGRTYLYLFTGRMDAPPVIFSEVVGFEQAQPDVAESPTPTPFIPTQIRFVNGIASGPLAAFTMDDAVVTPPLGLGQGSPLVAATLGEHILTVRDISQNVLLGRLVVNLEVAGTYSIFAYGAGSEGDIQMLLVSDANLVFDEQSPHMRLINLTQSVETSFDLAYNQPIDSTPVELTNPGGVTRLAIPAGTIRLLSSVGNLQASISARAEAGARSIIVIDSLENRIAAWIPTVELQNGVHYDVIAYQEPGVRLVRAFAVPYLLTLADEPE